MKKTKSRKLISAVLASTMVVTALAASVFSANAADAETGTLYYGFTEVTGGLQEGTEYYFLTQKYSAGNAVPGLADGSAILKPTATPNNSFDYAADEGFPNPPGLDNYVDVIQAGSGFDSCTEGGIKYTTVPSVNKNDLAWYYWCSGSGVHAVGPFYAYTYSTATFTAPDVNVAFSDKYLGGETVEKDELDVTISFDGKPYVIASADYTLESNVVSNLKIALGGLTMEKEIGYLVTYDANGATGGKVPTDANSPYGTNTSVTVLGNTGSLQKTGYIFDGWNTEADGSGVSYAAGATFEVTSNTTLYAQWAKAFTIKVTAGENGIITPDGAITVKSGDSQTFTIAAKDGYEIKDVVIDGVSKGVIASYTFENITGDHTIAVTFQEAAVTTAPPATTTAPSNPSTGDGTSLPMLAGFLLLSACGVIVTSRKAKSKVNAE